MRLGSAGGDLVELRVDGRTVDSWLLIAGQVVAGGSEWTFRRPCLREDEARALSGWLRALAAGSVPVGDVVELIEPLLSFTALPAGPGTAGVRIGFAHEALPRRGPRPRRREVEVALEPGELRRAADQWDAGLSGL